jgi:DNA-binding transcriptional regulator YiaG
MLASAGAPHTLLPSSLKDERIKQFQQLTLAGFITSAIKNHALHTEPTFFDLLKSVRLRLSMGQEDIARELGVSFATVNRWENGKALPSRLALAQFNRFCEHKVKEGQLTESDLEVGGRSD